MPSGLPLTFRWKKDWSNPTAEINWKDVGFAVPRPAWIKDTYEWCCPKLKMGKLASNPMRFDTFAEKVSRRMQVCEWAISQEGQSYSSHSRTRLLSLPASLRVDVFLDAGYVYDREFEWRWGWCGACETCLFWMNHLRWDMFHGMFKDVLAFFHQLFHHVVSSHLICKGKSKEYIYI